MSIRSRRPCGRLLSGKGGRQACFLDLEVAIVSDRLGDIEQQKIIEENIRVGGERFRRPIGLAVAHVPSAKLSFSRFRNSGWKSFGIANGVC